MLNLYYVIDEYAIIAQSYLLIKWNSHSDADKLGVNAFRDRDISLIIEKFVNSVDNLTPIDHAMRCN